LFTLKKTILIFHVIEIKPPSQFCRQQHQQSLAHAVYFS